MSVAANFSDVQVESQRQNSRRSATRFWHLQEILSSASWCRVRGPLIGRNCCSWLCSTLVDRKCITMSWDEENKMLLHFVGYAKSAGLLVVLPIAWNMLMSSRLPRAYAPEVFSSNIPRALSNAENTLRILVVALPFFAPFELISSLQKAGIATFGVGLTIYFLSWIPLIIAPNSAWSRSAVGFLAPAYTPIVWLLGLALFMQRLHWQSPYRWWFYLVLSACFIAAHFTHAIIVFRRTSIVNSG
jgi:hypothetical protein